MIADRPWPEFIGQFSRQWHQGEHLSMVGPTHSGKTTLALHLLPRRRWVVALGTKPRDATLSALVKTAGWRRVRKWSKRPQLGHGIDQQRLILWPTYTRTEHKAEQAAEFRRALGDMFTEGSWTVYADEVKWLHQNLGLGDLLHDYWEQGRALDITFVAGTQRPRWVPLEMYSQATHVFLWRTNDGDDLKRIGGLGSHDSRAIRDRVAKLDRFQTLYVNTRTGELCTTIPPPAP